MKTLSKRDRELVALGAALGSNCVPCVVFHVGAARKLGLSTDEIREALTLADTVRQVPAKQVLSTAEAQLDEAADEGNDPGGASGCSCSD